MRDELGAVELDSGFEQHGVGRAYHLHYVAGLDAVEHSRLRIGERREIKRMAVRVADIGGHKGIVHPRYHERYLDLKFAFPARGDLVGVHFEDVRDLHARQREGRNGESREQDRQDAFHRLPATPCPRDGRCLS